MFVGLRIVFKVFHKINHLWFIYGTFESPNYTPKLKMIQMSKECLKYVLVFVGNCKIEVIIKDNQRETEDEEILCALQFHDLFTFLHSSDSRLSCIFKTFQSVFVVANLLRYMQLLSS